MLLREKDLEVGNITSLPVEIQTELVDIKNGISLSHEGISSYGKEATKKLTDFSAQILNDVKMKDSPEVEEMIGSLMGELSQIDANELTEKKSGFLARFFRRDQIKDFVLKYESISGVIEEVKTKLMQAEYQLKKDIRTSEIYLETNQDYIHELDKYIAAGNLRVSEETENLEETKKNTNPDDMLAVQELAIKEAEISALRRKLHNMQLQRAIAIQNIPQIMLLKQGDSVLVEKIEDSIDAAIPLWQSQMVIAIATARQESGVRIQKAVTDTTNRLLSQNSEQLKKSTLGVATELERDIVNVETLKKSNQNLIDTLSELKKIKTEGEARREIAAKEIAQLQGQLNQVLLENK